MQLRHLAITLVALTAATTAAACGGSGSPSSVSAGCKPAHTFSNVTKGALTVATYDLPPFTKVQGTDLTGVDGDILKSIAKKECQSITVNSMATAAVIPTIQAGRADIAAGAWYRTAARAKVVSLSAPMYIDQMAFVSKDGITKVSQLQGRKVGTVDGYLWVADIKKVLSGSVSVYSTPVNMYQDLKSGRIDVGIDSFASGKFNASGLKVEVTEPDPQVAASVQAAQIGFPVPKDNTALLDAINADIAAMHSSGELAKILTANNLPASAADTGSPRLSG